MHFSDGISKRQVHNASLRLKDLVQLLVMITRKHPGNSNSSACCKSTQGSVNYLSKQNYLHISLYQNFAH